jgi:hypothetical protein
LGFSSCDAIDSEGICGPGWFDAIVVILNSLEAMVRRWIDVSGVAGFCRSEDLSGDATVR